MSAAGTSITAIRWLAVQIIAVRSPAPVIKITLEMVLSAISIMQVCCLLRDKINYTNKKQLISIYIYIYWLIWYL